MLLIITLKIYTGASMKHTVKNLSDTKVLVTVTLNATELADIKVNTLDRLAKKLSVSGFRPGKVPANVAQKTY